MEHRSKGAMEHQAVIPFHPAMWHPTDFGACVVAAPGPAAAGCAAAAAAASAEPEPEPMHELWRSQAQQQRDVVYAAKVLWQQPQLEQEQERLLDRQQPLQQLREASPVVQASRIVQVELREGAPSAGAQQPDVQLQQQQPWHPPPPRAQGKHESDVVYAARVLLQQPQLDREATPEQNLVVPEQNLIVQEQVQHQNLVVQEQALVVQEQNQPRTQQQCEGSLRSGAATTAAIRYLSLGWTVPSMYVHRFGEVQSMDPQHPAFLGVNLWSGMRQVLAEYRHCFNPTSKGWFLLPRPFSKHQATRDVRDDEVCTPPQYYPAYFEVCPRTGYTRVACLNILWFSSKAWYIDQSRMISCISIRGIA